MEKLFPNQIDYVDFLLIIDSNSIDLNEVKTFCFNVLKESQDFELRGKTWRENHIVTVAADGVWFSRFSES